MTSVTQRPKAYLIVAYYNRQKWQRATSEQLEAAEAAAEDLFPDKQPKSFEELAEQGELMARSFDSDLFAKVAGPYNERLEVLRTALQGKVGGSPAAARLSATSEEQVVNDTLSEVARDVRDLIVDRIYTSQPPQTPVGWMVVVDAEKLASYVDRMGGKGDQKGLWPVFNIEILPLAAGWDEKHVWRKVPPLRDDANTKDIYDFMTPTNWGH